MAKVTIKSGDEYLKKLERLSAASRTEVCGRAVYAGAEIVTDAIRAGIQTLPTDERFARGGMLLQGPRKKQKQGLLDSLGITPLKEDWSGYLDVKAGFDGYNTIKSRRWPKGQPNQMVARSVERGTSFLAANPFVKKAVSKSRRQAVSKMKEAADRAIERIMRG